MTSHFKSKCPWILFLEKRGVCICTHGWLLFGDVPGALKAWGMLAVWETLTGTEPCVQARGTLLEGAPAASASLERMHQLCYTWLRVSEGLGEAQVPTWMGDRTSRASHYPGNSSWALRPDIQGQPLMKPVSKWLSGIFLPDLSIYLALTSFTAACSPLFFLLRTFIPGSHLSAYKIILIFTPLSWHI